MKGTVNTAYEQRDLNSYGLNPLFLKKRLATNFSMFAGIYYLSEYDPWTDSQARLKYKYKYRYDDIKSLRYMELESDIIN